MTRLLPLLLLPAVVAVVAGCVTQRPEPLVQVRPLPSPTLPRPELRYPERVQAYHLGRHIDPLRPGLMRGAHPVYRIEAEAAWNLHPDEKTDHRVLPLPTNPAGDPAFAPRPLDDAIVAELNRQQDATERVMWEATQLARSYDQLQDVIADMTRIAAEFPFLRHRLDLTTREVRDLQGLLETITGTGSPTGLSQTPPDATPAPSGQIMWEPVPQTTSP